MAKHEAVCTKGHRFPTPDGEETHIPSVQFDEGPDWCMVCLNEALLRLGVGRFRRGTVTKRKEAGR